ncbi:cupin domain-containing protein [Aulosira sp. FACHB-615]|uniref:cupin domain-containing protein n=1 Tax=Aulosira sp. FACHB-615 TaxID=2692777 RepID=UPI001F5566F7|nr:cupin domain-containing protein [Aulosira sp. FACHB-615]
MNTSILTTQQQPEVIVNPVTGDRMTILETGAAYSKIRFDLPPKAKGSPLHYHTKMSETFTVLQGCLEMEFGHKGNRRTLYAGESLHVPAGVHHSFHNPSDDWVAFTSENKPAAGFEQFIRSMYGLAIDGKVNHEGMPTNLLYFALLLKKADIVLVGIPRVVQTLLVGVLVRLGDLISVERSLVKYWHK